MWIFYKCACFESERLVEIPDRVVGQDVLEFMEGAAVAIGADHRRKSPRCREQTMEYAKIPFDNPNAGVGFPATKQ